MSRLDSNSIVGWALTQTQKFESPRRQKKEKYRKRGNKRKTALAHIGAGIWKLYSLPAAHSFPKMPRPTDLLTLLKNMIFMKAEMRENIFFRIK